MLATFPPRRPPQGGSSLDLLRAALASRVATGKGPAGLDIHLPDPDSPAPAFILRRLEGREAFVAAGAWREEPRRPAGALLEAVDALARWAVARDPELVQRFGRPFVTLLPAWRRDPLLESVPEWRTGLADYALRGCKSELDQFFRKRNVAAQLAADLVSFVREAAWAVRDQTGLPLLLWLERADRADPFSLQLLRLLECSLGEAPLVICMTTADGCACPDVHAAEDRPAARPGFRRTPRPAGELLRAAAVFTRAFTVAEWRAMVPGRAADVDGAAEALLRVGTLRATGGGRLAFSATARREAAYAALDPEEAARLHRLAFSVEAPDGEPWGLCRHAAGSGDAPAARRLALEAMERSWAVCDYDTAAAYARRALTPPGEGSPLEPDLLLALLHYEAGRYTDAERHFWAAVEARAGQAGQAMAKQMLGYNALIGLGRTESGREILQEVLGEYEARGWKQQAGYVRNSIAYTLDHGGRFDETEALGDVPLRLVDATETPDGVLEVVSSRTHGGPPPPGGRQRDARVRDASAKRRDLQAVSRGLASVTHSFIVRYGAAARPRRSRRAVSLSNLPVICWHDTT